MEEVEVALAPVDLVTQAQEVVIRDRVPTPPPQVDHLLLGDHPPQVDHLPQEDQVHQDLLLLQGLLHRGVPTPSLTLMDTQPLVPPPTRRQKHRADIHQHTPLLLQQGRTQDQESKTLRSQHTGQPMAFTFMARLLNQLFTLTSTWMTAAELTSHCTLTIERLLVDALRPQDITHSSMLRPTMTAMALTITIKHTATMSSLFTRSLLTKEPLREIHSHTTLLCSWAQFSLL